MSLKRPSPDVQLQTRLVQSEGVTIEVLTVGDGPWLVMLPSMTWQTTRIQHASHALIPEQPAAVTDALIQFMLYLRDAVIDKK